MTNACQVCGSRMHEAFRGTLLGRHEAIYHLCPQCDFLRTQEPTWLSEAYAEAIADSDTGLVDRNLRCARTMTVILSWLGLRAGPCVDVAGGYGLFVRLMRDAGMPFFWQDRYAQNLLARGYAADGVTTAIAVTAFEVLEHLHDPVAFLAAAQQRYACQRLFITTEVYAEGQPPPLGTWRYYAPETGQHIAFYTTRTLARIATRLGLTHQRFGPVHALLPAAERSALLPILAGKPARILGPLLARRRSLIQTDHLEQVAKLQQRNGAA